MAAILSRGDELIGDYSTKFAASLEHDCISENIFTKKTVVQS